MRMSQLIATLTPPPMHQPRMHASVGFGKSWMAMQRLSRPGLIACHRFLRGAHVLELRDVGAGDERLLACAGKHHQRDGIVAGGLGKQCRNRLPHVHR